MPQPPQPRGRQLQPDHEQQRHDPQLGDPDLPLGVADAAQHVRPHHCPRNEVAQGGAQPQPPEQQNERQRRAEQDEPVAEERGSGVGFGHQNRLSVSEIGA